MHRVSSVCLSCLTEVPAWIRGSRGAEARRVHSGHGVMSSSLCEREGQQCEHPCLGPVNLHCACV